MPAKRKQTANSGSAGAGPSGATTLEQDIAGLTALADPQVYAAAVAAAAAAVEQQAVTPALLATALTNAGAAAVAQHNASNMKLQPWLAAAATTRCRFGSRSIQQQRAAAMVG
mmetsp:Transcript_38534/g.95342  ORF Transcript_38534/g.95342 Transcript_38534/m.95342 type:complete len:113 (+) Transcript_38534:120-458(+)